MPEADPPDDPKARELIEAAARLVDALDCLRDPLGNVIYLTPDERTRIAFHLARTGADVHPEKAIIKRRRIRDRPGQLSGVVDWVPIDTPDDPTVPPPITATGGPINLDDLDDAIPWHIKTKIAGDFS